MVGVANFFSKIFLISFKFKFCRAAFFPDLTLPFYYIGTGTPIVDILRGPSS